VSTLVTHLGIPEGFVNAAAVNNQAVPLDTPLHDGDEISLFPPAAGGQFHHTFHVFIAGVMQGQRHDDQIEAQDYRRQITQALRTSYPHVTITDPWALHPNSVHYDEATARKTFLTMTQRAGQVDALIAYLPQVSMGTAMEMWEAHQNNVFVVAVTPFVHHWAIRFTADLILPTLDELFELLANGRFHQLIQQKKENTQTP
ncbi:MAG: hypothetical protein D6706_16090, partial [Chloroflexi bacterium]